MNEKAFPSNNSTDPTAPTPGHKPLRLMAEIEAEAQNRVQIILKQVSTRKTTIEAEIRKREVKV